MIIDLNNLSSLQFVMRDCKIWEIKILKECSTISIKVRIKIKHINKNILTETVFHIIGIIVK